MKKLINEMIEQCSDAQLRIMFYFLIGLLGGDSDE